MKRMKKLLTGLLTLAMTLSMMTMTAFAADTGSTGATTTKPTIDTSKEVSLTIHKYEYNGNLKPDGTGSATDVNNVPAGENGAKPLSGVQFTIWKVADLADYYGEDGAVLPKVEDFELDNLIYTIKEQILRNEENIAEEVVDKYYIDFANILYSYIKSNKDINYKYI